MNYTFYTNSERAWKSMYGSILGARESIYLEMYIFNDDMVKYNFHTLLKEKAIMGLKVKIILDSFGSKDLSHDAVQDMKDAGVEILFLSYLMHRTHRKILIVDNKVAFLGGVNIHHTAKFWNDLVVKVKGNLVTNIIRSFAKAYKNAGGRDAELLSKRKVFDLTKINAWLVENSPMLKNFDLKSVYKKHINSAQKNITLVTPYFMPRRWLAGVLHQAVLRGVCVEILIPEDTDIHLMNRVNFYYIYKLSKLGVKFHIEKNMNHAKLMIIDGKEGMVGSQNLDFLSFDYNSEIGVFFTDEKVVAKLQEIINVWKIDTRLFDTQTYKPLWIDYVLSPLIKIFGKIV